MNCVDCNKKVKLNGAGRCKSCQNRVYNAQQKTKDPEGFLRLRRAWHLRSKYGISLDQYEDMYQAQRGLCAICRQQEKSENQYGVKVLAIDHDHKTGVIRGLLCHNCNRALGLFKDNPISLQGALAYLGLHNKPN